MAAQEPELLFRATFDDLTAQVAKGAPKSGLTRDLGFAAKEGFNKSAALLLGGGEECPSGPAQSEPVGWHHLVLGESPHVPVKGHGKSRVGDAAARGLLSWVVSLCIATCCAQSEVRMLSQCRGREFDYGVWVPRPVDQPLPLKRCGDEVEFTLCGVRIRAILAPGHSFDCVVYLMQLSGKRIAFMGDIASEKGFIEKAWNDTAKGKRALEVCRAKVLPFQPDHVFHGHRVYPDGMDGDLARPRYDRRSVQQRDQFKAARP